MTPSANETAALARLAQALMELLLAHEEGGAVRARRGLGSDTVPRPEGTTSKPASPEQLLLTPKDAARYLAVSERTLARITAPRGPLPSVHLGRSIRYPIDDLKAAVLRMRTKPVGTPTE